MTPSFVAPLFVPATRPDRFAKAAESEADAVILDLEDAVAPEDKDEARRSLDATFTDKPVIVRINAAGTPWHEADLSAVAALPVAAVMLPKAECTKVLAHVATAGPVIPLIESARGLAAARQLAASGFVSQLAFGSIDFAVDLGCDHERSALAHARAEIVMASRLAGLAAPIDGVTSNLADPLAAGDDATYARVVGFGGKLLVHPSQAGQVLAAFRSSAAEIAWAKRVLALPSDRATMLDGQMIDAPVRVRARKIFCGPNGPRIQRCCSLAKICLFRTNERYLRRQLGRLQTDIFWPENFGKTDVGRA